MGVPGLCRAIAALTPSAVTEDEPDPEVSDVEAVKPVSNQIRPLLPVLDPAGDELRSHLDDNIEFADVEWAFLVEPDLEVADLGRTNPRLLRTRHRFRDDVR